MQFSFLWEVLRSWSIFHAMKNASAAEQSSAN